MWPLTPGDRNSSLNLQFIIESRVQPMVQSRVQVLYILSPSCTGEWELILNGVYSTGTFRKPVPATNALTAGIILLTLICSAQKNMYTKYLKDDCLHTLHDYQNNIHWLIHQIYSMLEHVPQLSAICSYALHYWANGWIMFQKFSFWMY